jgi:serine/threonine protein kinase
MVVSPIKRPAGAGISVKEPGQKESVTAAPVVAQPASVLNQNDPERTPGATASISDQLRPGKLFAWFALQRELNIGSTGGVWLAEDYSLRRHAEQVVLKFLPAIIATDKTAVEELKSDIRRTIALKHPNIVQVYDLVEDKGIYAIQMEYADGESLSRLRSTKPNQIFEVRDLEKWVKELCEALEYAHKDIGFINGDIVPDNLLVDVAGNLKLKDFGIANCIAESMNRLMVANDTSDTLAYMSPQRARGQEPAITDDLYSLGAIIYELLTGKPPFYAGDIGVQVSGTIPPSMSERRAALGIEGEAIPKNWEETVAACLAKDPIQRPQSAVQVKNQLLNASSPSEISVKSAVGSLPDSTAKPHPPVRIPPKWNPWLVTLGILFILAFIAAIVVFLFSDRPDPGRIVRAKEPSFTPTGPPFPSASAGQTSLWLATRSLVARPSPNMEASPTPSAVASPTPSPEASPTPSPAASPAPSPVASPAPSPVANPAPSPVANPAPSPVASLAPSPVVSSAPSPEASPAPSPEASPTSSPEESPTLTPKETGTPNPPQAAVFPPTTLSQPAIDATKEEVLKRINALPGVTDEKKADLIAKMLKARSMERLAVVHFDNGRTALRRAASDELVKAFDSPELRDKLSDPTVILVVAGYADPGGRGDLNLRFSQERAEYVSKILKEQARLLNAMQTIGMGGTELLDGKRPDQNRAVEVWIVVPL